mmetsp:Transcript_78785/g.244455  ORF Transcript_78785/g.244455 Transcript_78785/m.244455 type:complete len:108 (+) Transcript_78785:91-414(+)
MIRILSRSTIVRAEATLKMQRWSPVRSYTEECAKEDFLDTAQDTVCETDPAKMTKIAVETEDEGVRFTRNADGELVAVRVEKKLTIDDDIPPAPTTDSATEDQHCGM